MGAIVLGIIAGVVCFVFCSAVKNAFGYDDALDVFGVHCIGGIIGAILTGILVNPTLGGTGIMNYETGKIAEYVFSTQVIAQCKAVGMTLVWSGVGTLIILKVIDVIIGLRAADRQRARRPRSHRSRRARLQHVNAVRLRARISCPSRAAGEGFHRDTVGVETRHRPLRREASAHPEASHFFGHPCVLDGPASGAHCMSLGCRSRAARILLASMPRARPLAGRDVRRASARLLTRPIPSSGEAMPLVGLGSWITFNVGNDPPARAQLRRGDARVLRGGRAHDQFLADVRLVARRDRRRVEEARRRRMCSPPTRCGSRPDRADRRRSKPRANSGACRSSTSCRCTICSPGKSICARCSP